MSPSALFEVLAGYSVELLNVEQVVIRDRLTRPVGWSQVGREVVDGAPLRADVIRAIGALGLEATIERNDDEPVIAGLRPTIVVPGPAHHRGGVRAVAREAAALGVNIGVIRGCLRLPVTGLNCGSRCRQDCPACCRRTSPG